MPDKTNKIVLRFFIYFYLLFFFCFVLIYILQLRVIRAFRSTLEDLEERRSVHSLHSLRSSRSHPGLQLNSNVGLYLGGRNLSPLSAQQHYHPQNLHHGGGVPSTSANLSDISYIDEDPTNNVQQPNGNGSGGTKNATYNADLLKPIHETRI